MPDAPVAVIPAAAPPADNSQAVTPAPVTIPHPDAMFETIKAKLKAANPQLGGEQAPKAAEKPADDETLPLNLDPKVMRTLGRLQKEVRELSPKAKELDVLKPDAEFAKSIRDLWKGTPEQRLEALAKLSGRDGTDELAALVQFFYERDQAKAAETNEDGTPKPVATPELKAVLDRLDAVTKELAAIKEGGTAKEKADRDAKAKADADAAAGFVGKFLTDNATKYEISARKENAAEAVDLVQAAILTIALKDGMATKGADGVIVMREQVTPEQAHDLYHRAAAEVEEEFRAIGRRFASTQDARTLLFDPNKYNRPLSRPQVTPKAEGPLPTNLAEREKELARRYKERFDRGEFRRG